MTRSVTSADIVATARTYERVRWLHQGRNRQGLDCIGLVIRVAHDLGLSDFDVDGYGRLPVAGRLAAGLDDHMTRRNGPHQPGDVLLMTFDKYPQHVAISTDVGVIHAAAQMRKVVEHRIDDAWQRRIVRAYQWPGVTYG